MVSRWKWYGVIDQVNREVFDKPEGYYTLDELRKAAAVDRRLTLREILEKVLGLIPQRLRTRHHREQAVHRVGDQPDVLHP